MYVDTISCNVQNAENISPWNSSDRDFLKYCLTSEQSTLVTLRPPSRLSMTNLLGLGLG